MLVLVFLFWGYEAFALTECTELSWFAQGGVPCARSFSSLLFSSAGAPWFKAYGDD